jgi:plasmid stabilization system protein ParE
LKPLRVAAPAEAELREGTRWYQERDERVAERFVAEIRYTLRLIEQFPGVGTPVAGIDDPDVRQMPVHGFPYNVVFVNLPDRREVIAFAHKRQRPAYFADRLPRR